MSSPMQSFHRSPAWRERFRGQFHKTKMCRFYEAGNCRFEESCPFAHFPEDLSVAPDLKKTALCKAWKRGVCKLSPDECPFAHGDDELCITNAFVEKPLSKRVRATAESKGLVSTITTTWSNPQDGDQCQAFLEEIDPAAPLPCKQKEQEFEGMLETAQKPTSERPPGRRQRRRNTSTAQDGSHLPTPLNLQAKSTRHALTTSPSTTAQPLTYGMVTHGLSLPLPQDPICSIPIWSRSATWFAVGTAPSSPMSALSPIELVSPMFDNNPPEKVAEMLRQAMPDFYED